MKSREHVTPEENKIRMDYVITTGYDEKCYEGFKMDGDVVVWNEKYVKWLEQKIMKLKNDNLNLNELDQEEIEFIENLNKLTKKELVDYIGNYWQGLRSQAIIDLNDKENYKMEEFGGINMTQVNKMKFLLMIKI